MIEKFKEDFEKYSKQYQENAQKIATLTKENLRLEGAIVVVKEILEITE